MEQKMIYVPKWLGQSNDLFYPEDDDTAFSVIRVVSLKVLSAEIEEITETLNKFQQET